MLDKDTQRTYNIFIVTFRTERSLVFQYKNFKRNGGMPMKKDDDTSVKVTVTIPDNIPDALRQSKINKLYDILSGGNFKKAG